MKQRYREILTKWRLCNPTGTLPKTEFPGLLRQLCEAAKKESIVSSFRATGISPIDRQQVLKRLPSKDKNDAQVKSIMSDALLETLAVNVGLGQGRSRKRSRPTKKVVPGKRIRSDQVVSQQNVISVFDDEEWFCCFCAKQ